MNYKLTTKDMIYAVIIINNYYLQIFGQKQEEQNPTKDKYLLIS